MFFKHCYPLFSDESLKINSITIINQENLRDTETPTHALTTSNLTTPPKSTTSSFQNEQETNDMVRPFTNSLTGITALPFQCTELQPITGRQDMDLSQHMSMVYNPASTMLVTPMNGQTLP